jgi:hypothetical protein
MKSFYVFRLSDRFQSDCADAGSPRAYFGGRKPGHILFFIFFNSKRFPEFIFGRQRFNQADEPAIGRIWAAPRDTAKLEMYPWTSTSHQMKMKEQGRRRNKGCCDNNPNLNLEFKL